ncbi:hypothetical protein G9A89_016093 [Geosiphon pyriformis]|nr:hypothetical protein G9A89_016093 [Geosiphon pyriformis]
MSKRTHNSTSRLTNKDTSSKRVRFNQISVSQNIITTNLGDDQDEVEFNHEDSLEPAKVRRGAVKLEGYGSDETDTSEDDGGARFQRRKGLSGKKKDVEEDMFASDDDDPGEKSLDGKHTKKGKSKTRYLGMEDIHGQEFGSFDYDSESSETPLEAFNMKAEMEEGKFDEAGNYIRNKKDPNEFHDNWLQGVSRDDIKKARIAQEKQEKEKKLKEAQQHAEEPMDRVSIWKELLTIMQPGENILEALQRLGGGSASKSKDKRGKRVYKKKIVKQSENQDQVIITIISDEEDPQESQRKRVIERLTELSDRLLSLSSGQLNVYEDTWEQILRNLKKERAVSDDWMPAFSISQTESGLGVDNVNPTLEEPLNTTLSPEASMQPILQWEYKWTSGSSEEVYGPFSGADMKAWTDEGYFTQGILVREFGSGNDFISANNVNFFNITI